MAAPEDARGASVPLPSVGTEPLEPAGALTASSFDLRGVLRISAFRRLYTVLALSSLGDWLGLLATTALARQLAEGNLRQQSFAIGGVLVFRLAPAVLLGPLAGAFADRFDRRRTMVVCDVVRFLLFASIPLFHSLVYLLVASFVIEAVGLFWIPAKEASVPNLVPKHRLEAANQLSLITTYGSAPVAAGLFALLSVLSTALGSAVSFFDANPVDLALYFNATTFLFSALVVARLVEITGSRPAPTTDVGQLGLLRSVIEGWRFVGQTPMVRGLVVGMLGAFAAGGTVVATGRLYVGLLGGGDAAYGVLFGAVFLGLAAGMGLGSRLLPGLSRNRLCGLSIVAAGASLAVLSVLPNLALAVLVTLAVGGFAGVAWVTGYTLLGLEVADDIRGRTFATLQSLVRVDLLLVLATVPFIVGAIGDNSVRVSDDIRIRFDGVTIVLFVAGVLGAAVGLLAYRQMDDRPGVPLWSDLMAGVRGQRAYADRRPQGLLVAVEGGEGAGKSTQVRLLAEWLRSTGREVVVTHEPGATVAGRQLRSLLLDPATGELSPRTEALLYAADRAEHVTRVVRPALDRAAVVVTDRYVDSSLAYQGAGRELARDEVEWLSRWATEALVPDLTVVLDLPPSVGLPRITGMADRIEAESLEFHDRVRRGFLDLAAREPRRYLVVDATLEPDEVHGRVRARVAELVPPAGPVETDGPVHPPGDRPASNAEDAPHRSAR